MKKILLILACIGIIMANGKESIAGFTDHPNIATLNSFSSSMVGTIGGLQQAYFVKYGVYFQGLWLLGDEAFPDGIEYLEAEYTRKPSDQADTWQNFGPALFKPGLSCPANVKIDVYESPDGWGYIVTLEIYYPGIGPDANGNDGDHWVYKHNEGPEARNGIFDEWYIQPDM